jgi:hypothetical protein
MTRYISIRDHDCAACGRRFKEFENLLVLQRKCRKALVRRGSEIFIHISSFLEAWHSFP